MTCWGGSVLLNETGSALISLKPFRSMPTNHMYSCSLCIRASNDLLINTMQGGSVSPDTGSA